MHPHSGTKEIGGTCLEIESQRKRIVLDIGCPLNCTPDKTLLPEISEIQTLGESLLGIIISYAHLDHYGLLSTGKSGVPILIV